MKFLIKQKVVSLRDSFTVTDEEENEIYSVLRQAISLRRRLYIMDDRGANVSLIQNKIMSFMPQFEIFLEDGTYAKVKKKFKLFGHEYEIESSAGNFAMTGNFLGKEFQIYKEDSLVATVSKTWMSWADTYGIEIVDDENVILLLSIIMTIDASIYDGGKNLPFFRLGH